MMLNPQESYVLLDSRGTALRLPGGDQFWQLPKAALANCGEGWLISEYFFEQDWPTWEMHPHGDEFMYLLSGEVHVHVEGADDVSIISLKGSGAVILPRGMWHTTKVVAPARMLHIARGLDTQTRST